MTSRPKFFHGDHVVILPLEEPNGKPVEARVTDVHCYRTWTEYDVRWFAEGKSLTARMFEDELEAKS